MEHYDVIIIGGGPAGLSAGMYAARAALKTVLLEKGMPGGQAATTDKIENYPGFPEGIPGPELAMKMDEQARKFGLEVKYDDVLTVSQGPDGIITVKTYEGEISSKTLIIAGGAESKLLGVPGEQELRGRGVSYCATCDGAFFQGKKVAVVGGGDSALQESIFLTKFVQKVYVIHRRGELRATKVLQDKAFANPQIEFILDSVITNILGNDQVEVLKVKNLQTGEEKAIAADGVFVYAGKIPSTNLYEGFVTLDDNGYILTDAKMQTSRPGVFAAGDVRQTPLRQVVTAVADGAIAAVSADEYIEHLKGK
ncbi:MAG: thioredoxin-disulfide reductase [Thermincola sp.]|jgi:thioredoxin reductase (NADPH)|nr:thioredoxin-disulfide reductase [Thermincola sp.]MDT3703912.1 thioredoxin-disulfide reductase [Thermincola sp.]